MKEVLSDIKCFTIKGNQLGPEILISAGVHGDEYEPMLAALELYANLPALLVAGTVRIVAVVNSTAFMAGTRNGIDGLDLARICPGKSIGTESEISAAQISTLISSSDYYIDMHTGGRLFNIHPLTGYTLHLSEEVLNKQRKMAVAFNLPIIWGTDSTPDGRTLSVARDANIPAIYVEYGGGGVINEKIVSAYYEGCINVLKSLDMILSEKNPDPQVEYWVEDDSPDSGHLQAKMPSPFAGIFMPDVKVGERITKGQLWGRLVDPIANRKEEIMAEEEGLVLFIRVAALVQKGQSLGGVLPISNLKSFSL